MMLHHTHRWDDAGACAGTLSLGGRAVPCHARRCAAPTCDTRRDAPGDYCGAHRALGRALRLTRTTEAR